MEYKIIYSKRKTIAIQITRTCEVIVRAPIGASKKRIEDFVTSHSAWIQKHLESQKSRAQRYPEPSREEISRLKARAREILPERVAHYSSIIGVTPAHISINEARTRFGSCSEKGRINFSCRLARYPLEAIDYVVVHELAHLKFLNHSRQFWSFVEEILPDYKARKGLLK